MTDYERLGGADGVRAIVTEFVEQVHADFIIGFFFEGRDRERILTHEIEHASRVLGGDVAYTGRPVAQVHPPLRINRGHFQRRLAILRTVLSRRGVDAGIVDRWLAAEAQFESVVTDGTECVD